MARQPFAVALIGPLPPPFGGMANQCQQLAALLVHEGIAIDLVRVNPPPRPACIGRIRGVRGFVRLVTYLAALWRASARANVFHVFANSGWAWHLIAAPAIFVARLRHVPVIVNYRGGNAQAFFAGAPSWVTSTLKKADSLVVPSRFLQEVFQEFGCIARVIPNIIDLDRFKPRPATTATVAPHIVVTRNLEAIYDISTALRAFALVRDRFPDARMSVAGTGPELTALRGLCATLNVTHAVSFLGRLDNREIAELYQAADLMLNPSLVDNMPNSILEAFASNVPVVSTNVGGVPFIAEHERTILLTLPGDPFAMATAITRIVEEPGLSQRLMRAGHEEVKRYTWDAVRELWLSEYARIARPEQKTVEAA